MTYEDITKSAREFRPALRFDAAISHAARAAVRRILYAVAILSILLSLEIFTEHTAGFLSVFFLSLSALGVLIGLEIFYSSIYYMRLPDGMSFELARVVSDTNQSDITGGFLGSRFGRDLAKRLGLAESEIGNFLSSRSGRVAASDFVFAEGASLSLASYARAVFESDKELKDRFFGDGLLEDDFTGAALWLERNLVRWKEAREWWSRRNLSKVQGLGKALSYGQVWLLKKYASEFAAAHDLSGIDAGGGYHAKEADETELVLSRSSEANALLVAEDTSGALDVVERLAKRLANGSIHPALEHKQLFELDTNALIAATGNKNAFELTLMKLMQESIKAGNIVLVIPDLVSFMSSAATLGSDVASVIDPYISSSAIQIIALADVGGFHQSIETNNALMQRFERVSVKGGTNEETIRFLEDRIEALERRNGVFFTYQALTAVAESADRYFVDGVMPDKAVDLLVEIIPKMKDAGKETVGKQDVLDLVEQKTGIPVAGVKAGEKEKLGKLEEILRQRIVGQELAITAISDAMRRARAGVSNPNRPMGSFLFIGPTGVGKTETTKALAEVFFGDENKITRFDMSEYSADDALTRLIGSFDTGKPGTFTTALRENPYGVLLLDEFEKANKEVHNLFLQVLDEGVFSDMTGKKVNARNLIIIATSNAGSDLIWTLSQNGKDLAQAKGEVIDDIITKGIFKPELMNRFDGVILFHALGNDDLRSVARIQLERLKKRLEERKLDLEINDALVEFLVKQGSDPKFGARPLNRAIQETVEAIIAKKLIDGSAKPGAKISLTEADLAGNPVSASSEPVKNTN
jgi:ATP-dependent Clp protease ATP-binding subunit ClpC